MTDTTEHPAKPAATPEFRAAQRWNIVWVVPIIALLIGGWMVYRNYASKGPVARVVFSNAEGIIAGQTEVRCLAVRVGLVKEVTLTEDLKSVRISVHMEPNNAHLLRADSRFWVVKPRISGAAVSGLNTLWTGAYIELEPGAGKQGALDFQGLAEPPPTSRNVPGRRLVLKSPEAGSLSVGSPIFFRGVEVGRIESRTLAPDGAEVLYDAFVHDEYKGLLTRNTRFWNASALDISAGATGVKVRAPSLTAMLAGGAAFGVPDGLPLGGALGEDGAVFKLFADEDEARNTLFDPDTRLLLMFEQSVLGLAKGAAVRFRGINVGRVLEISYDLAGAKSDPRIPVLVEVDSAILCRGLQQPGGEHSEVRWTEAVEKGLRAALKSESLLVNSLYVDMDCYPDLPLAHVEKIGDLPVLPTVAAGFAQLEEKLTLLMNKLDSLPLEETMIKIGKAADESASTIAAARSSLDEINAALKSVRAITDDPATRALPAELRATLDKLGKTVESIGPGGSMQGDLMRTLDELRAALRAIKSLTNTLEDKPSSIIFDRDSTGNPTPKAPQGKTGNPTPKAPRGKR